jgi:hypothetical protein
VRYNLVVEPGLPVSPPSKAVRLFTCLRPGPVRRFSYVQRRAYRDVSETPSEAAGNTAGPPEADTPTEARPWWRRMFGG